MTTSPLASSAPPSKPGHFEFGIGEAAEERAQRLHRESIVFDMLFQHAGGNIFTHHSPDLQAAFRARMAHFRGDAAAVGEAIYWPYEQSKIGKSHLIRDWLVQAGLSCGSYDIDLIHDERGPQWALFPSRAFQYAALPWLRYVTTAEEIRQAKRDGVIAFYGNCQPTIPAPRNLKALDVAYGQGLRSFMLTYNRMDHIGVGSTERVDAGLSMFGVDVVQHCNRLGMLIDVSHCGHLTTMDACKHSIKPVTANHTSARGLYFHVRGKSDEALRAIADTGGVVGVLAVPALLTDAVTPTIEHMLDHINYIAERIGWQHVAIGTDWPMQAPDDLLTETVGAQNASIGFRPQDRIDVTKRLVGFDDYRDLPNITRGLVKRGYSDEQIRAILGGNALRVFEQVCG